MADPAHTTVAGGRSRGGAGLARIQGIYFLAAGAWPLVHLRSFERVTGGKRESERWLVKTVGVLAASIGLALLASTRRRERPTEAIKVLGLTSALGFLAVDVWYVAVGRIAPIYLVDAAAEAALALSWLRHQPTDGDTDDATSRLSKAGQGGTGS